MVFLKTYNPTLCLNLRATAVYLPITVKRTDIWIFGFENTRVCLVRTGKRIKGMLSAHVKHQTLNFDSKVAREDFSISST